MNKYSIKEKIDDNTRVRKEAEKGLGMDYHTFRKFSLREVGKREKCEVANLKIAADFFNVSMEDLLSEDFLKLIESLKPEAEQIKQQEAV